MFAYVSYWKMKGYQGVQLLIRTKHETVFALFFLNLVFFCFQYFTYDGHP